MVYWRLGVIVVERFNVLDYGADPTGATDSAADVASALAALVAAGGGVLYFPAGTYWLVPPSGSSFGLAISSPNVHVEGDGIFATTLTIHKSSEPEIAAGGLVAFSGFDTASAADVSIRNIALVGSSAAAATGQAALVFASVVGFEADQVLVMTHNGPGVVATGVSDERTVGGRMSACTVVGVKGDAFQLASADRVDVVDSTVISPVAGAELPPDGVSLVDVTACSVVGGSISGSPGHGVFVNDSSWVSVERVEVTDVDQEAFGIFVNDDCTDVRVSGCHVHDTHRDGIHVHRSERVVVEGNLVYRTGDDGIATNGDVGTDARPKDVVIANNVVFGAGARGIAVMGRSDVLVEGNLVESTYMAGIGVEVFFSVGVDPEDFGPIDAITIRGNHLVDPGMAPYEAGFTDGDGWTHGITVMVNGGHPVAAVVIDGNVIRGCRNSYVRVWSQSTEPLVRAARVVIRDNDFSGPVSPIPDPDDGHRSYFPGEYHGIWVSATDDVVIEGNVVADAYQSGIRVDSSCSGGIRVQSNVVRRANVSRSSTSPAAYGVDVADTGSPVSVWANRVEDPGNDSFTALLTSAVRVQGVDRLCFVGANVGVDKDGRATPVPDTSAGYRADPVKGPVRLATAAALTSLGMLVPTFSVDGTEVVAGDRVLVKDQATAADNGVYVVQASGGPVRAFDFDAGWKLPAGAVVWVREGDVNTNRGFVLSATPPISVGTTPLSFVPVAPPLATVVPSASTPGGAAGSATTASRSDHQHPTTGLLRAVAVFTVPVGSASGGGPTELQVYSFTGGAFSATGDASFFDFYGTTSAVANDKRIRLMWDADALYDSGWETTAAQAATWRLQGHLVRVGAESARFAVTMLWLYDDGTVVRRQNAVGSLTADFSAPHGLRTTGASQSDPSLDAVVGSTGLITVGTAM